MGWEEQQQQEGSKVIKEGGSGNALLHPDSDGQVVSKSRSV